jgi:hypothetical protein
MAGMIHAKQHQIGEKTMTTMTKKLITGMAAALIALVAAQSSANAITAAPLSGAGLQTAIEQNDDLASLLQPVTWDHRHHFGFYGYNYQPFYGYNYQSYYPYNYYTPHRHFRWHY